MPGQPGLQLYDARSKRVSALRQADESSCRGQAGGYPPASARHGPGAQPAAMGLDPFGHAEEPGAAVAVKFERSGPGWLIGDFDVQAGGRRLQGYRYRCARSVLHGIGEAFLDDAQGIGSHGRGERVGSGLAEGDPGPGHLNRVHQVVGQIEQ